MQALNKLDYTINLSSPCSHLQLVDANVQRSLNEWTELFYQPVDCTHNWLISALNNTQFTVLFINELKGIRYSTSFTRNEVFSQ